MKNRGKNLFKISVMLLSFILMYGCSFTHYANIGEGYKPVILDRVERPYEEIGVVHVETWTTTLFWLIPFISSLDKAYTKLHDDAGNMGADAIINVEAHVDNRTLGGYMGFISGRGPGIPFILGSTDYHVSGMAIKFK
ncbi:MAG: hypothetical protein A3C43_00100 [Candidatus Schekmanbacteria bacterium RIFCSPHIGHO2_02_FULL_38_11]|uniref:Lipoprotein n=1 Tax=Candidatus Schekmanbacteria bacterium RIFCSPLOWO2_12_FULL_38_15 TaxID=1817883 RepID=A0A1F7SED6_9BACT|nr:MAG: hypothetical protein A2043_07340 [Candidatus Schekmanbacteria bacterium GWA2_38_9]OGL49154.1 MAG: hypothetical protein A3H37_04255 [Candidatus Schekmanbacteria bacterium RIFCSPLOWO2_02_FULL_38_14]OGL52130.1 MAG: hypothetical protein A3G31_06840 [Candidatus Schekmanbacteria bacterium RIFCSPLOWO2_12_FULL_38_15]OGL55586.1 MAG: hypothetical protein A3C43_00100 [Candidatus Schekmanbacteria bacterium RIFCSPHIGHO2_02_FULL_38_11]